MMDYFSSFAVSGSGLAVERLRLEAVALNLANVNSTVPPGMAPYQPVRVLSRPQTADFAHQLHAAYNGLPAGVEVMRLERMAVAPRMVYQPQHPDADAAGFVAYANIDPLSEMVTMMNAVRAYEANIKALKAAQTMAQRALDIGNAK